MAEENDCELHELAIEKLQELHCDINPAIFDVLTVERSVASRTSFGGTAPENVRTQIAFWRERLSNETEI